MPAVGTVGGILVGVNSDVFRLFLRILNLSVSTVVRIKSSGIVVRLTAVYGSPYEKEKDTFISELSCF
jgi:hypothetical protein